MKEFADSVAFGRRGLSNFTHRRELMRLHRASTDPEGTLFFNRLADLSNNPDRLE